MTNRIFKRLYVLFVLSIAPLVILCSACQSNKAPVPEKKPPLPKIETMVVVGFLPAMSPWDEPDMVHSPISGAVFFGGPVPEQAVKKLTASLFERLVKEKQFELISPGQARGVYSSLKLSDVVQSEVEVIRKIGRAFSADAVLIGYLYRWREREGSDYAASRPASVAFDLYLIRPTDGATLWKGRFDKTQQSLSENILNLDTFLKGQGRWVTAERLAEIGLEDVLGGFLKAEKGKRD